MTTPDAGTVFRTLAGALQTGAMFLDDQGSVVEVNDSFAALVGRPPAWCVGAVAPHPWWQGPDLGALVQAVASGAAASAACGGAGGPSGSVTMMSTQSASIRFAESVTIIVTRYVPAWLYVWA